MHFPGKAEFVAHLDRAMQLDTAEASAAAVEQAMVAFWKSGADLPAAVRRPIAGHYARRELHASREHGYSLIAMTWGPGQGTPVHDHSGFWGVECVWYGRMEVTPYALVETDGGLYRFAADDTVLAHPGDAGSLVPPHEHHTMQNPSATDTAVSLHLYCRPLDRCRVFVPSWRAGWLRAEERLLSTDPLE